METEIELIKTLKKTLEPPQFVLGSNRGRKLDLISDNLTANSSSLITPPPPPLKDFDFESIGLDITKILAPISDPSDIIRNPTISEIFKAPFLHDLDQEFLKSIHSERRTLSLVIKLLSAMLGDDDEVIMPQIMSKLAPLPAQPIPEPEQPLPPIEQDFNKFFAPPQLEVDENLGLDDEEANNLRDKLQLMQQLNMEYVNSLSQIRGQLTKTQRLRRNVLNWCREIAGEDYIKVDLDGQNNKDNAGLGDMPVKDMPK